MGFGRMEEHPLARNPELLSFVMNGRCALREREESLARHHLIPRWRNHNFKNQKDLSRNEAHQTVGICRPCHKQIHVI